MGGAYPSPLISLRVDMFFVSVDTRILTLSSVVVIPGSHYCCHCHLARDRQLAVCQGGDASRGLTCVLRGSLRSRGPRAPSIVLALCRQLMTLDWLVNTWDPPSTPVLGEGGTR